MGFAENLREELKFQDIQIKELSARTGISKSTIDKHLSERKVQPGVENAVKTARSASDGSLGESPKSAVDTCHFLL